MNQLPTVCVLGLGAMGHAFAANLLKNGFSVSGWNRTLSRGEDLKSEGLKLANSPQDAVAEADVVIVMLSDGKTTSEVLREVMPSLKQGAIISQMGTIGPDATQQILADYSRQRADVVFLDAPVSGTRTPAEQGKIVVLASGDKARAVGIDAVYQAIAKETKWLGEAGAGSRMKLVVNAWLVSMVQGIAESTLLARELGFSPDDLWQVIDGGPLAAPYVKGKLEMMASDNYQPQMQLQWALKDARLAVDAAKQSSVPGLENLTRIWEQAVDAGFGEQDLSIVYRYLLSLKR